MNITLQVESEDVKEVNQIREIFGALVKSGGLTGVKSGKTILHFDHLGSFMGIELDYRPWWKRKT